MTRTTINQLQIIASNGLVCGRPTTMTAKIILRMQLKLHVNTIKALTIASEVKVSCEQKLCQ